MKKILRILVLSLMLMVLGASLAFADCPIPPCTNWDPPPQESTSSSKP